MIHMAKILFLCSPLYFCGPQAFSTVLPYDYALRERPESQPVVDQNLKEWLQQHSNLSDLIKISGELESFQTRYGNLDEVEKAYVDFLRIKNNMKLKLEKVDQLKHALAKYKSSYNKTHPLTSEVLSDFHDLEVSGLDDETLYLTLKHEFPRSCTHKSIVGEELSNPIFLKLATTEQIQERLKDGLSFESYRDRTYFLSKFLTYLPEEKRQGLQEEIWQAVEHSSWLKKKFPWTYKGSEKEKGEVALSKKQDQIQWYVRNRQCDKAKDLLLISLAKKGQELEWVEVKTKATEIGNCEKRRGSIRRVQFWEGIKPELVKRFGDVAALEANYLIARYEWNRDEFDKSINLLNENIKLSKSTDDFVKHHSDAVLLSARIYENQGKVNLAFEAFLKFTELFTKDERYSEVISELVLIQVMRQNWHEVIKLTDKMIYAQDEKLIEERDSKEFGFALFWKGRAELENDNKEGAVLTWKRLAAEFYSTYYGALGHYLLEEINGKRWVVKPMGARSFDRDKLFAIFEGNDHRRVQKIQSLLKIGRTDQARCEIVELAAGENNEKKLAMALLKHAAGEWLSSIRLYANLPRSYRNILPRGMEMLLFPKKYEDAVLQYSGKLSIDPDLVFALIRQESVFNPDAKSSAGAKGLMQLMKGTARLEAKKINDSYAGQQQRSEIVSRSNNPKNLYDSDFNLLLGVHHLDRLMNTYESPVLTLSAYNAGPGPAKRWSKQIPSSDVLYFIEKIPYNETRQYVKLIMRNYFYYKYWYGGDANMESPYLQKITDSLLSSTKWAAEDRKKQN